MFLTTYQLATGLHLVFRRLTLRNGRAPNQGAAMELVWQEPGRLTDLLVEDVTFENNVAATSHADWGGGAIYRVTGIFGRYGALGPGRERLLPAGVIPVTPGA